MVNISMMHGMEQLQKVSDLDAIASLKSFSRKASIAVVLIGLLGILGWIFHLEVLTSIWPGIPTMKVNTGMGFVWGGISLGLWHWEFRIRREKFRNAVRSLRFVCAFLVFAIALLTLVQYSFHINLGIDQFFWQQPEPVGSNAPPGRMAPNTAVAFFLTGSALLLLKRRHPPYLAIQGLTLGGWFIGFLGLLGYFYGSVYFYTAGFYTGMALNTAIAFLLLTSGILCALPDQGMMPLFSSNGVGSLMLRRLLPAAIAIPILVNSLCTLGYRWHLYPQEMASALENILNTIALAGAIAWNAHLLNHIDYRRRETELAREQLAIIVHSSDDAIISKNLDGVVLTWNSGAERLFGYVAEEIVGCPIICLIPPERWDEETEIIEKIKRGESIKSYETFRRRKDGNLIEVALTISPIKDTAGKIIGVANISRDITQRKQVEKFFQRYERIISSTADAMLLIDNHYIYQIVNQTYLSWHQKRADELLGHSVGEFLGQDVFETTIKPRLDQCLAGQTIQFEMWYEYPTLERQFLSVTYTPYCEADQTISGVVVVLRNLTTLKQTEQRLQLAMEASGDGLWDWDIPKGEVYYSPRYLEMLGYAADEFPQDLNTWERLVHPDDMVWVKDILAAHFQHGSVPYAFDYRLRTKSGAWKWVADYGKVVLRDEDGKPLRMIGTHQDIHDRKQAEEALRQSEEKFRSAFEDAAIGMALVGLDGHFLKVNHSLCEATGYSESELLARTFQEITHPEDLELDLNHAHQLLLGEIRSYQIEKRYFHKQGQIIWVLLNGTLVRNTQGEPLYFIAQIQDINDRKQAEIALRQSEERYRAIVEDQTELICRFLADTTIVFVNDAYCRYFGRARESLIGKTYQPVIFEADREKVAQLVASINPKNPVVTIENRVVIGGEIRWTQWINRAFFDSQGCLVELQSVGRDITDRKRVELALRDSEQRFHAIFNSTFQFVGLMATDGTLLEINQTALDFGGLRREDVVGQLYWAARWWRISQATQNQLKDAIAKAARGEFVRYEVDILGTGNTVSTIDFSIKPVKDETGKVILLIPEGRDISERKKTELELRTVSARLQYLVTSSPGLLFSCKPEGDFGATFMSENIRNILGYEAQEWLSDSSFWISHIHPEDRERILTAVPQLFQTGNHSHEYRLLHQDGNYHWVYNQLRLIADETGKPIEIVGYLVDISDRKQAEEQIQASLREKEVLLREIHHRVKNNMQIIYSLLRMQARRTQDEQTMASLRDSQDRIKSMALVHEKLYRSQDLSEIDFDEYVQSLAASLFSSYGINQKLISIERKIERVFLDVDTAIPCGLIINELISNSLKYAFPGNRPGKITIQMSPESEKKYLLIFQDNGVGFLPSFDIEEMPSLGLKLVTSLVNQLDGTMEIDSQGGTQFKIVFTGR